MGIYDDDNSFSLPSINISLRQLKYPVLAILAIIVAVALLVSLNEALKPKPLSFSLSPNPLDLSEHAAASSMLNVNVFNTSVQTESSLVVRVEEIGSGNLIISPASRRIDSMASGTERTLDPFVIRPNPGKEINSGSYKVKLSLFVQGEKKYEDQLTFVVKAV